MYKFYFWYENIFDLYNDLNGESFIGVNNCFVIGMFILLIYNLIINMLVLMVIFLVCVFC